jgi:hypothetical protein
VLGSAAIAVAALAGAPATASQTDASGSTIAGVQANSKGPVTAFRMVRSAGAVKAGCIPYASAKVTVQSAGPVEVMNVWASGLPKKTGFDFFVIQTPDAPFGLSWYQGDLETDKYGKAHGTFVGRFNEETFSVSPGVAPAPQRHKSPFADAKYGPQTAPVHQYHLGLWFNSPKDAKKAGCGDVVTPFNGEHNAGAQALSTRQFKIVDGPLGRIKS